MLILTDTTSRRCAFWFRVFATLGIVVLALNFSAQAAVRKMTADNVQVALAAAQCGDTIKAEGSFIAPIVVRGRPRCPVVLDLIGATINKIGFYGASNWTVKGGTFTGGRFMAVQVINSDHLKFLDGTYRAYGNAGISLLDSSFILIQGNSFSDANADGVDLVSSQDVEFRNNSCTLFYTSKLHADCLQMWNKPGDPLTVMRVIADGNQCTGNMQCIVTFGAADPRPVSDITITNNRADISTKWAGAINTADTPCLRCTMKGNVATTYPGMPRSWERPGWYNANRPESGNVTGK